MNRQKLPALLALFCCLLFSSIPLLAQSDRDRREAHPEHPEKSEKEPSPFFSRLWFGGGVSIGFSGYDGRAVCSGSAFHRSVAENIRTVFRRTPRVAVLYLL